MSKPNVLFRDRSPGLLRSLRPLVWLFYTYVFSMLFFMLTVAFLQSFAGMSSMKAQEFALPLGWMFLLTGGISSLFLVRWMEHKTWFSSSSIEY